MVTGRNVAAGSRERETVAWHTLDANAVLARLDTSPRGLLSVFALQALTVLVPSLRAKLDTVSLGVRDWGIVLVLAAVPVWLARPPGGRALIASAELAPCPSDKSDRRCLR